jgi:hypothetical protein
MELARVFPLRVHDKAELSFDDLNNRIELKLVNKETGDSCKRTYYKLDESFSMVEALKIDTILYHMHNKIGLNLWDMK